MGRSSWFLVIVMLSGQAGARGGSPLRPGEVRLIGRYQKQRIEEKDQRATYYVLPELVGLGIHAKGPVTTVLHVRGTRYGRVGFKLDFDGQLQRQAELDASPVVSRGLFLRIPPGSHKLTVMPLARVLVRPTKVFRKARTDEVVVDFTASGDEVHGSIEDTREEEDIDGPPPLPEETMASPPERQHAPVHGAPRSTAQPMVQLAEPKSILVMDLQATGVDDQAAATLAAALAERLATVPGLRVSTMADIRDTLTLEQTRQLLGCREDTACMAEVTDAMRADLVLTGSVGTIGNSVVLSLTLVDAAAARPLGRASETATDLDALPALLPGMVARLFGSDVDATRFRLQQGQEFSFAVFDLAPTGVSRQVARNLTQILSVEIKRIEGTRVVSRDDLTAMLQLEQDKSLLGCKDDTMCIVEIGGALGVDKLVVGQVGKLAARYVISLRMIDPRRARVDSRVTESFRGDEEQLIRAVRHAGRRLLGVGQDAHGTLAVSATEEEAYIYLDAVKRGRLPMPPVAELPAGRHTLRVAKDGYFDWRSDVYVDPAETTAVWARLEERPARWYQKWWVWTLVGMVVAGGVTAAILLTGDERAPPPHGDVRPGEANIDIMGESLSW